MSFGSVEGVSDMWGPICVTWRNGRADGAVCLRQTRSGRQRQTTRARPHLARFLCSHARSLCSHTRSLPSHFLLSFPVTAGRRPPWCPGPTVRALTAPPRSTSPPTTPLSRSEHCIPHLCSRVCRVEHLLDLNKFLLDFSDPSYN